MMKVIVFQDGGAWRTVFPAPGADLDALAEMAVPDGANWMIVDHPGGDAVFNGTTFAPNLDSQRLNALRLVDDFHADVLRQLTGGATIEERDTWKAKEEAARALIAGSASEVQASMIQFEADGAGIEPSVLAQVIVAKADKFLGLIGRAAGLRAKAKAAIEQATSFDVPADEVGPALDGVISRMKSEAVAAVSEWLSENNV